MTISSKLSELLPQNLDEANQQEPKWQTKHQRKQQYLKDLRKQKKAAQSIKELSPNWAKLASPNRRPRFPIRLCDAAERAARIIAKDVLLNGDQDGAEDLIGLAMWLESFAAWRRGKSKTPHHARGEGGLG